MVAVSIVIRFKKVDFSFDAADLDPLQKVEERLVDCLRTALYNTVDDITMKKK